MRVTRFVPPICLFLVSATASAQAGQRVTPPSQATKDPQAVSALNQALTAAGGLPAITAIEDYTAAGVITYYDANEVSGSATIRESGLTQLRVDALLPAGMRSEAMTDGELKVAEAGVTSTSWDPPPFYPGRIVAPNQFLAAALVSGQFSLTYGGVVEIDGRSTRDIEIQRVVSSNLPIKYKEGLTIHVFVDAITGRIVMMQDVDPRNQIRQTRYSDYRSINGALTPFVIAEQIANKKTWSLQLSQITFNTGLQDSDFQL